jgi:hypothetical protein
MSLAAWLTLQVNARAVTAARQEYMVPCVALLYDDPLALV